MSTYEPCVLGSDGNCTRWSHDHAADRPSVTDNARAERQRSEYTVQETAAYFAGRIQRLADRMREDDYRRSMTDVVALGSVQAFLDRIARDDFDVFAAGRAETTTATIEDAEEVLHGAGWFARADLDPRDLRGILHDLADAGLLATARAETTTATTEDAALSIRCDIFDDGTVELNEVVASNATPNRAAGLLATARTRPTREQIAKVLDFHFTESDYDDGCALRCGYHGDERDMHLADAVLALFRGGDK